MRTSLAVLAFVLLTVSGSSGNQPTRAAVADDDVLEQLVEIQSTQVMILDAQKAIRAQLDRLPTGTGPRSSAVRTAFLKASGYPQGRPGYVADHHWPLCAGGADSVANLQWQTVAAAKAKDVEEKRLCARIRKDVRAFLRRYPAQIE